MPPIGLSFGPTHGMVKPSLTVRHVAPPFEGINPNDND